MRNFFIIQAFTLRPQRTEALQTFYGDTTYGGPQSSEAADGLTLLF